MAYLHGEVEIEMNWNLCGRHYCNRSTSTVSVNDETQSLQDACPPSKFDFNYSPTKLSLNIVADHNLFEYYISHLKVQVPQDKRC